MSDFMVNLPIFRFMGIFTMAYGVIWCLMFFFCPKTPATHETVHEEIERLLNKKPMGSADREIERIKSVFEF